MRADNYNGISSRSMVEPRVGASYRFDKTNTVIRGSYGKFFMTPYNENLVLSSSTGAGGLAQNIFGAFGANALKPGKRNHFSAGFEQAIGSRIAVQGDYFWKYTDRDYDFDILFNTPLSFPIQWHKSKIDGYAIRANLTPIHGISAYAVLGHSRSRFFGPEVGGILFNNPNTPLSGAPFRIDHDQAFQQTTHLQYQKTSGHGPLLGFNWTYESGLVAGKVPFSPTSDPTSPDFQVEPHQPHAGPADADRADLRRPARHHRQPADKLPGRCSQLAAGEDSCARHRERRQEPAAGAAAQHLRRARRL